MSGRTDTWKSLRGPLLALDKGENACQDIGNSGEPCCKGECFGTASQPANCAKNSRVGVFLSYHQCSGGLFNAAAFESFLLPI